MHFGVSNTQLVRLKRLTMKLIKTTINCKLPIQSKTAKAKVPCLAFAIILTHVDGYASCADVPTFTFCDISDNLTFYVKYEYETKNTQTGSNYNGLIQMIRTRT